jgi:hypothetical protein
MNYECKPFHPARLQNCPSYADDMRLINVEMNNHYFIKVGTAFVEKFEQSFEIGEFLLYLSETV